MEYQLKLPKKKKKRANRCVLIQEIRGGSLAMRTHVILRFQDQLKIRSFQVF
uniref:Uncharacterized protein n=1 Tax=Rhizophora mucronata TaxID=61149 RepID=A0A2P2IWJ5_RHIMU